MYEYNVNQNFIPAANEYFYSAVNIDSVKINTSLIMMKECILSYGIALVLHGISLYCMVLHGIARCCIVWYGIALYRIKSYGIAWYCIVPLLASARGLYLARHLFTLLNCLFLQLTHK